MENKISPTLPLSCSSLPSREVVAGKAFCYKFGMQYIVNYLVDILAVKLSTSETLIHKYSMCIISIRPCLSVAGLCCICVSESSFF